MRGAEAKVEGGWLTMLGGGIARKGDWMGWDRLGSVFARWREEGLRIKNDYCVAGKREARGSVLE